MRTSKRPLSRSRTTKYMSYFSENHQAEGRGPRSTHSVRGLQYRNKERPLRPGCWSDMVSMIILRLHRPHPGHDGQQRARGPLYRPHLPPNVRGPRPRVAAGPGALAPWPRLGDVRYARRRLGSKLARALRRGGRLTEFIVA